MIFKWRDYWGGRGLDEIRQASVVRFFTSATNKMKDCRMLGPVPASASPVAPAKAVVLELTLDYS